MKAFVWYEEDLIVVLSFNWLKMSNLLLVNVHYVLSQMMTLFVIYAFVLLFTKMLKND